MREIYKLSFLVLILFCHISFSQPILVENDQSSACDLATSFDFRPMVKASHKAYEAKQIVIPKISGAKDLTLLFGGGVQASCYNEGSMDIPLFSEPFTQYVALVGTNDQLEALYFIFKVYLGLPKLIQLGALNNIDLLELLYNEERASWVLAQILKTQKAKLSFINQAEIDFYLTLSDRRDFGITKEGFDILSDDLAGGSKNGRSRRSSTNTEMAPNSSPEIHKNNKVSVLFGTNRKYEFKQDRTLWIEGESHFFNGDDNQKLNRGVAMVTIPTSHRVGQIERPVIWRLQIKEDEEKHVIVQSVSRMSKDSFSARLKYERSLGKDSALIFIHGFNVDFNSAIRSTAVLGYDLDFKGSLFSFSWPSDGALLDYMSDRTDAESAVPYLIQFLKEIKSEGDYKEINLIAHSMGNYLVSRALQDIYIQSLESRDSNGAEDIQFNQLILAAPDLDIRVFRDRFASIYPKFAKRVSLYGSNKDLALITASETLNGQPRLGALDPVVVFDLIDTIDASSTGKSFMELNLNHSYYLYENFIKDLRGLIYSNHSPGQRRLEPAQTFFQGQVRDYWLLK